MPFRLSSEVPLGGGGGTFVSIGAKGSKFSSTSALKECYYLITLEPCFGLLYLSPLGKPVDFVTTRGFLEVHIQEGIAWDMKPRTQRESGNPERLSIYAKETTEQGGEIKVSFKILNAGEVTPREEAKIATEHAKLVEKEVKVMFVPVSIVGPLTGKPGWHFSPKEGETHLRGETTCVLVIRTPISRHEKEVSISLKAVRTQFMYGDKPLWGWPLGAVVDRLLVERSAKQVSFSFDLQGIDGVVNAPA